MSDPEDENEDDGALDPCDNECPWCGFPRFDCKCDDEDEDLDAASNVDEWIDEWREGMQS